MQLNGIETPGACRGVGRHQAAECVIDTRSRHRDRAVDRAFHLRIGTFKIDPDPAILYLEPDLQANIFVTQAVVLHHFGRFVGSVRNGLQGIACNGPPVFVQCVQCSGISLRPHLFNLLPQARATPVIDMHLR